MKITLLAAFFIGSIASADQGMNLKIGEVYRAKCAMGRGSFYVAQKSSEQIVYYWHQSDCKPIQPGVAYSFVTDKPVLADDFEKGIFQNDDKSSFDATEVGMSTIKKLKADGKIVQLYRLANPFIYLATVTDKSDDSGEAKTQDTRLLWVTLNGSGKSKAVYLRNGPTIEDLVKEEAKK